MKKYVLGFIFDNQLENVLLIHKTKKRDWQFNLLNGIGGECLSGESPESAMIREYHEEVQLPLPLSWEHKVTFDEGTTYMVDIFKSYVASSKVPTPIQCDEGEIGWYNIATLHNLRLVPHTEWFINCVNSLSRPGYFKYL